MNTASPSPVMNASSPTPIMNVSNLSTVMNSSNLTSNNTLINNKLSILSVIIVLFNICVGLIIIKFLSMLYVKNNKKRKISDDFEIPLYMSQSPKIKTNDNCYKRSLNGIESNV